MQCEGCQAHYIHNVDIDNSKENIKKNIRTVVNK